MQFNVYTGDGNFGTSFDHEIEAASLDEAVKAYMEGVKPENRDLFDEEGDDECAILSILEIEGDEGPMRAYNGGCYFVAEIRPASVDPRR